ncbi:MAG: ABC transporter permease [Longimicrobiales bacterium]
MDLLHYDVRYALRRLLRSPGFTTVAIVSLALGIGANSAIFSIVNSFLLRDLGVQRPDRLVEIYTNDDNGFLYAPSSVPDYRSLQQGTTSVFDDVVAYEVFIAQNNRGEASPLVMGELVSGNYFRTLGVQPVIGRSFRPEEDATPGTDPVVILSHGYWQRVFAGDRRVLGQTVQLNRRPYTVVGVAPRNFKGAFPGIEIQMFVPLSMINVVAPGDIDRINTRNSRSLFMKARLTPGVSQAQASAALTTISQRLEREFPQTNNKRMMHLLPTESVSIHPAVDKALVPVAALLLAVVGLVLLIACANLASFLLARAADRRKEIAVRLALGAGRARMVRQLLVESTMLAAGGGLLGIGLAFLMVRALLSYQPPLPVPLNLTIGIDGRVLLFTSVVSILAGLAFGLVPALQSTRPQLAPTLRDEAGQVTGGRRRITLRNALVIGQVATSLVLLIGSGLFVRSLQKAQAISPGFYTGPAAILRPHMEMSGYDATRGQVLQQQLVERLRQLPGVTHVARAELLPLGAGVHTQAMNIDGVQPPAGRDALDVDVNHVDEAYFSTLDIPIVAGRAFSAADHEQSPLVVVVSQAAVRAFWADREPIGQTINLGRGMARGARVIGVARDTKVRTLGERARPYIYMSSRQRFMPSSQLIVRGNLPATQLLAQARRATIELDPHLVLFESKTMEQHLALMLYPPRMAALLLSIFGGLALLLAATGLYGLVSYSVARRTREIGIRMALGATTRDVIQLMTGSGLRLVITGSLIGIAMAAAVTWLLSRFLYGISATDLVTFMAIPIVLGLVGFMACYIPARRASRASPVQALVSE